MSKNTVPQDPEVRQQQLAHGDVHDNGQATPGQWAQQLSRSSAPLKDVAPSPEGQEDSDPGDTHQRPRSSLIR